MHKREIALWGTMLAVPAQADPGLREPPAVFAKGGQQAAAPAAGATVLAPTPALAATAHKPNPFSDAQSGNRFAGSRPVGEWPQAWML